MITLKEKIEQLQALSNQKENTPAQKVKVGAAIMAVQAYTLEEDVIVDDEAWNAISPEFRRLAIQSLCLVMLQACAE